MSSEKQAQGHYAYNLMIDIRNLVGTGILESGDPLSPLGKAAIVHLLVLMHDLLQRANDIGQRIAFTDDVGEVFGKEKDVTTLVANVRSAACHITSEKNRIEGGLGLNMVVIGGKRPTAINGALGCDYEDDWALIHGPLRIYYRRHILRAFDEAKAVFGVTVWHDDPRQFLPDSR